MDSGLLEQISQTSSRLDKERLIATMDETTRRQVALALDPNITFGITTDDEDNWVDHWHNNTLHEKDAAAWWDKIELVAARLASRDLSGGMARATVDALLGVAPSPFDAIWACRFFNKNLRAGFDIRTLNKIFEGSVEKFSVWLADAYDPDDPLRGFWYFEPKLDGNRYVILDGKAWSRNGKPYDAADYIIEEIRKADKSILEHFVLDGEMMGNLGFDQSSGALRRKDKRNQDAVFTYWCFDIIKRKEWDARRTAPVRLRKMDLEALRQVQGIPHLKTVPFDLIKDPTHEQIMAICKKYVDQGFEGAMAKWADAVYKFGRGREMQKVKLFKEADLRIIDFYEGKGKHKGRLGGVIVQGVAWDYDKKGQRYEVEVESKCGSGFDDPTRDLIWENKADWLDAVVEVQYQEITPKKSLRFPVFVRRRKDKE